VQPKKLVSPPVWPSGAKQSEHLRYLPFDFICFALAVEIQDDPSQEEWKDLCRDYFWDTLRERNTMGRRSLARVMMEDSVGEFVDRIGHTIGRGVDPEDNPSRAADAETMTAVFDHFGLNPNEPSHRGFLLAILADIYFNTPVQGRPKGTKAKNPKWNDLSLSQLGATLRMLEQMHPGASDVELSKILKEKSRSAPISETLRKRFKEARSAYKARER
jgi:hypothetical protein